MLLVQYSTSWCEIRKARRANRLRKGQFKAWRHCCQQPHALGATFAVVTALAKAPRAHVITFGLVLRVPYPIKTRSGVTRMLFGCDRLSSCLNLRWLFCLVSQRPMGRIPRYCGMCPCNCNNTGGVEPSAGVARVLSTPQVPQRFHAVVKAVSPHTA